MLESANDIIGTLSYLADQVREPENLVDHVSEAIETLTLQRDDAIEEMTRLTCELEVAKLSLRNAQDQFGEQVEANKRLRDDRHEYRSMLVGRPIHREMSVAPPWAKLVLVRRDA